MDLKFQIFIFQSVDCDETNVFNGFDKKWDGIILNRPSVNIWVWVLITNTQKKFIIMMNGQNTI